MTKSVDQLVHIGYEANGAGVTGDYYASGILGQSDPHPETGIIKIAVTGMEFIDGSSRFPGVPAVLYVKEGEVLSVLTDPFEGYPDLIKFMGQHGIVAANTIAQS